LKNSNFPYNAFLSILFIHVVYFLLSIIFGGIYTLDSPEYIHTASNLITHGISYAGNFTTDIPNPDLYSLRPPGYGFFIMMCSLFSENHYCILVIQNVLSIIVLYFIYKFIYDKIGSKDGLFWFWIGLVFFPVYFVLVNMVMADAVLGFILVMATFSLHKYLVSHQWIFILFFNLLLGVSLLVKPVMMYFWIPNLLFSVYLYFRHFSVKILLTAFILPLIAGLWSYRNYQQTGYFHFSSIKMQNLLELNAGAVISYKYDHETMKSHRKFIRSDADKMNTYKEKSEFLLRTAEDTILNNKAIYSYLHLKGMANFMLAPGRVDIETFFKRSPEKEISLLYEIEKKGITSGVYYYFSNVDFLMFLTVLFIFIWNIISLPLLFISFFNHKLPLPLRIFIFILLTYIVFVSGPGGYARFKTAIYPLILILIPFGADVIKQKFIVYKKGRKKLPAL
jgi:hypothetical protein